VGRQFQVEGIPFTVVIGPDGKIAWTNTGARPGAAREMAEMVKKLVAPIKPSASVSTVKPPFVAAVPAGDLVEIAPAYPHPLFVGTPIPPADIPNLEKPDLETLKARLKFKVPKGTENVAKGKIVTSSDALPIIGTLDLVTDGEAEGSDGCYVELAPGLQWVQIDLGAEHSIWKILAWHFHKQPAVYFDMNVQVSNDPDFKKDVVVLFNNDHDNSAKLGKGTDLAYVETNYGGLVDGRGAKARYVRLYSNGNTANEMNHYVEVQVYGTVAGK
jgi:hypothetical protein